MTIGRLLTSIALIACGSCFQTSLAQDDPSQRLLPLPESNVTELPQHLQMLKRLRSLIESQQNSPPSETTPTDPSRSPSEPPEQAPIQPQQFQQLQEALKSFTDKLPPGFVPPNLSNIPPEQLQKALDNPAVQQQMREMLKQFARDGVLPQPGTGDNASQSPLPPRNSTNHDDEPVNSNRSSDQKRNRGNDEAAPNNDAELRKSPPTASVKSLRDFLKKLYDGSTEKPVTGENADTRSSPPSDDSSVSRQPLRQPLRRRDREAGSGASQPNNLQPDEPGNNSPPLLPQQPNLNPLRRDSDEYNDLSDEETRNKSESSNENLKTPSPSDMQSAKRQLEELQTTIEKMMELSERANQGTDDRSASSNSIAGNPPFPAPVPSPSRQTDVPRSSNNDSIPNRDSSTSSRAENGNSSKGSKSPDALPDVSSFLKDQLKSFKLPPNYPNGISPQGNSSGDASASKPNRDVSEVPKPTRDPEPPSKRQPFAPMNSGTPRSPENSMPSLDIQKELQRRGFGETLKKIVERAKEESRQPKATAEGLADPKNSSGKSSDRIPQLSDSMAKMLDGLKDDLVEIAQDARFNEPSRRPERNGSRPGDSADNSNSMFDSFRKSASEVLAGPKAPSANRSNGNPSPPGSSPLPDIQFDFSPVLVLAALIAAAGLGFFGLRFLKFQATNASALQLVGPPIQPSEIQNRADIVRAFHEFAMRSTKPVQSWWTHRAVERVIVASSPEKQAAVETLANTYEQARYLPVDHELTADQLQSARNALKQCSTGLN